MLKLLLGAPRPQKGGVALRGRIAFVPPMFDVAFGYGAIDMRQFVVLVRALVDAAEVLLLNKPTSTLDLRNQALVLRWVGRLAREDALPSRSLHITLTTRWRRPWSVADAGLGAVRG